MWGDARRRCTGRRRPSACSRALPIPRTTRHLAWPSGVPAAVRALVMPAFAWDHDLPEHRCGTTRKIETLVEPWIIVRLVELRDIEIFLTLAEELHFGRTAERLRVSPARISQSIKQQERRIG